MYNLSLLESEINAAEELAERRYLASIPCGFPAEETCFLAELEDLELAELTDCLELYRVEIEDDEKSARRRFWSRINGSMGVEWVIDNWFDLTNALKTIRRRRGVV